MANTEQLSAAIITASNPLNRHKSLLNQPAKRMIDPGKDMLQGAMNKGQLLGKSIGEGVKYKEYKQKASALGANPVSRGDYLKASTGKSTNAGVVVSKVGSAIGGALSSEIGNAAMDMISGLIPDKGKNTSFKEQQQIGNVLMKANPMVGGIYKAASILGELTGTNVSKMSADQAKAAGIGSGTKTLNNLASYVPGVGVLGSTVDSEKSHLIDSMAGAYGGSVSDINTAGTMGEQNYLFGKRKANRFIREMNDVNKLLTDINTTNTLRKSSDYGVDIAQQNLNRYAGTNYMDMRMGKNGMKFIELDEVRLLLANRKQNKEVEKFANGGVIDGENLMPTGRLHKELHHIADSNPELEGVVTRKGIPVVAIDENGDLQAVAEIERDEICLSKSLTDEIERLRNIGDEQAMIDAGKLLVSEILFNTKDDSNVIWEKEKPKNNS